MGRATPVMAAADPVGAPFAADDFAGDEDDRAAFVSLGTRAVRLALRELALLFADGLVLGDVYGVMV